MEEDGEEESFPCTVMTVEIERHGTRYAGTYVVADGTVTVYYRASSRTVSPRSIHAFP